MAQTPQYRESLIDYGEFIGFIDQVKELKPKVTINSKKTLDLFRLYIAIKLSGISLQTFFEKIHPKKVESSYLQQELIKYIVQSGLYNFGHQWYRDLKRAINEMNYRYTQKRLIHHDTVRIYKILFRLYCRLVEDKIYSTAEYRQLENLMYFIAAQYSARFHPVKGLVIPVKLDTFQFESCAYNYRNLRYRHYPPTMIDPGIHYMYHKGLAPYHNLPIKELLLSDSKSDRFITYELPVLEGKIPKLKNYSAANLRLYLESLEYCMIRDKLLQRNYQCFLLSIEHLRVYAYAKSVFPLVFPNTF